MADKRYFILCAFVDVFLQVEFDFCSQGSPHVLDGFGLLGNLVGFGVKHTCAGANVADDPLVGQHRY